MERVVLVVALVALVTAVAWLLRRRTTLDAPTQSSWTVPAQLDRDDFESRGAPWLVVVFSSSTCLSCGGTWAKAEQLASSEVAVQRVDAIEQKDLHERYRIDAVPCLVVADAEGVVRASFLGEPSTADLWDAVAGLRDDGAPPHNQGG